MRPHLVVVFAPRLDDDLGFGAGAEPFAAQALVAYPSGEGRLYADDVIVNIAGAGGTMMVSA